MGLRCARAICGSPSGRRSWSALYPCHHFKRRQPGVAAPRKRLGRLIRDIGRKTAVDEALTARFAPLRSLVVKVLFQHQRQRGQKVYARHAREFEFIGKGKARTPYEFGCKLSVATPVTQTKGGQFVLHAKALHGNPFNGQPLPERSPIPRRIPASRSGDPMSIRAIADTMSPTNSASGLPARFAEPPPPSNAR